MRNFIIVITISLVVMSLTLSGCVDKNSTNNDINKDTVTGGEDITSDNNTDISNNGQVDVTSDSEYNDSN